MWGHLGSVRENLKMIKMLEKKQQDLQKSIEELKKEQYLLDALCHEYTSVYKCDLAGDYIKTIKLNKHTNDKEIERKLGDKKHLYSERVQYYYTHYVNKETSPDFLEKLNASYMRKYLTKQERMLYQFQIEANPAGNEYYELQAVRIKSKNKKFKVVIGFRCIDETIKREKEQQQMLQDALTTQIMNNEIISAISKIYWLIYRMDLLTDTFEEISSGDNMHLVTGRAGRTSVKFEKARKMVVAQEYQEIMKRFLDTSTLAERMKDTETLSQEYRTVSGNWHTARFIVKKRDGNGDTIQVLYVVRIINDQKKRELEYQEKLRASMEEAKRANSAKTDFLRHMSHDIRTPINAIKGFVEIGDYYSNDLERQAECRQKIGNATSYLLELVSNVLDMNELESGQITLENRIFNLEELLKDTEEIIEIQAKEKGVTVLSEKKRSLMYK